MPCKTDMTRDKQVIAWSKEGWSLREMALALGVPKSTIGKIRHRNGFVCDPGVAKAAYERGMARAKAEGTSGKSKSKTRRPMTPEQHARRTAMIRAKCAEPEHRAKLTAQLRRAWEGVGSEEIGRRISRAKLPWCPEHLKAEYHTLIQSKRLSAAEARAIMESEWAKQLRGALRQIAAVAALPVAADKRTAFEIQLDRVRNGAKLVPTFHPGRVLSEHRSLTGGSMADLAA